MLAMEYADGQGAIFENLRSRHCPVAYRMKASAEEIVQEA
jgi:hypothetical protein